MDTEEVLESIAELKKVNLDDKSRLELKITGEEVSITLKQTRNNVAPGPGGFGGSFKRSSGNILRKLLLMQLIRFMRIGNCLSL